MSNPGLSRIPYALSDLSLDGCPLGVFNTSNSNLPIALPSFNKSLSPDALLQSFPAMMAISLVAMVFLSVVVMNSDYFVERIEFLQNGRAILSDARKRYGKQPYRLIVDTGECLNFPPEYAVTIRNNMDLSFAKAIKKNFSGHVSSFEMYAVLLHEKRLVQSVVQDQLTKYLNVLTKPLSEEATHALDVIFGQDAEWKETVIAESILQLIARLSTRVFLGRLRNNQSIDMIDSYIG
ncbi:cytochrome p450 [Pyrenophora tritici-repentis]|nr:cytochrome p450 [Pyrenophora tritici-repentis]KAI1523721.1 cytochrome p450 [Pyrenophora tritici-repentis]KAI1560595.1 cytochrome p450 [Pyrenophora tritici-repentis]KAI1593371.1 cytochrome p450 [Pyrenophora tritici-repentis]PWO20350.1 hypothetical protein PtrARCrB10_11139 [Pyrenophora tritici-repentis]